MRVLFVGHCTEAYVGYLNRVVKSGFSGAVTGVFDYNRRGTLLPKDADKLFDFSFSTNMPYHDEKGIAFKIKVLHTELFGLNKFFMLKNFLSFRLRKLFRAALHNYRLNLRKEYFTNLINEFNPTIVHFNFLATDYLEYLNYVNPSVTVILSFWGSDLMNTSEGLKGYEVKLNAMRRAQKITIQTLDLRTILLSKFGHEFLPKVKVVTFSPLPAYKKELLDKYNSESARSQLRSKYNVPEKNVCIQIGYSAAKTNQHLKIIEIINMLNSKIRSEITLFVPLTYGNISGHVEELEQIISGFKLDIRVITEYMSEEETAQLTNICEIFIHLRDSDALNASMVEALYVQNCVITGSWLPYGSYLRSGIYFFNIDSISDLKNILPRILSELKQIKLNSNANKSIIEKLYDSDELYKKWISIYM